jgi:hypothetical protein
MDVARKVTGVKATSHDDGGLMVHAAQDSMDAYVVRLAQEGVALRGLELDVTPLESLFFELTGAPGQDAEPPPQEEPRQRWRRPRSPEVS